MYRSGAARVALFKNGVLRSKVEPELYNPKLRAIIKAMEKSRILTIFFSFLAKSRWETSPDFFLYSQMKLANSLFEPACLAASLLANNCSLRTQQASFLKTFQLNRLIGLMKTMKTCIGFKILLIFKKTSNKGRKAGKIMRFSRFKASNLEPEWTCRDAIFSHFQDLFSQELRRMFDLEIGIAQFCSKDDSISYGTNDAPLFSGILCCLSPSLIDLRASSPCLNVLCHHITGR